MQKNSRLIKRPYNPYVSRMVDIIKLSCSAFNILEDGNKFLGGRSKKPELKKMIDLQFDSNLGHNSVN